MEPTPHIMSRYDKDLGKLKRRIMAMGTQVIDQLADATEALDQFDAKEVDRLVAFDRTINGMHQDIYTPSERLIALRQPMALDLRQVLLPINIAHELERIGDHAKSTAKRARILADRQPSQPACDKIREMSAKVQAMLAEALRAYDESDVDLAATVRETDLTIDQINKDVFAMQVTALSDSPEEVEANVHLILLARGFERAGDHVVNIARHVHQIVTGIDLKASD